MKRVGLCLDAIKNSTNTEAAIASGLRKGRW